jgi:hypothetical protein
MMPNLSFGSGATCIESSRAHLATSAPFRAGHRAHIRPVIETLRRRRRQSAPVSRRLSARRHSLLGHPFPPGDRPSSRSAHQTAIPARTLTGFPRSAQMRRDRGGCPLYPGDGGVLPVGGSAKPTGTRRFPTASPYTPLQHPPAGPKRDEASTKVHSRSPVRSSPCLWPADGTRTLGLLP